MKTNHALAVVLWLSVLTTGISEQSWAQLDTVGFPLDIGNKWYYRYVSIYPPSPIVLVKTITDTAAGGLRFVRTTRLGQDSVTRGTETWTVTNGSFFANSLPLYNSSLTHDSSWSIEFLNTIDEGSIRLQRVNLWGSNRKSQFRSTHTGAFTSGDSWNEQRVGLGVGWYYDHGNGYGGESSRNYTYQLIALLKNGVLYGDTILTSVDNTIAIVPSIFALHQNFPNPFNPTTTIKFQISRQTDGGQANSSFVSLKVFDLLGREVATLVNEEMKPGSYERRFDGTNLSSGVYLYKLQAGSFVQTRKLLLLR